MAAAGLGGALCHTPSWCSPLIACRFWSWIASGQTTNKDRVQCYPSRDDRIKVLVNSALPTRGRPSFSHHQFLLSESLHKPPSFIHQRANRRSKKIYNPAVARKKTASQKVKQNENAEDYVLDEGTRWNSRETTKWNGDRHLQEKFRIMILKIIWDLGKRMEKMQEIFTKNLQELKDRDEQYARRNQ